MNNNTSQQATGASESARFFCTQISSAAGAAGELKQQHKKEPNMANKNTNPGIGKVAVPEVMNSADATRARTHARVVRPTGILKESLIDLPGARVRIRARTCAHSRVCALVCKYFSVINLNSSVKSHAEPRSARRFLLKIGNNFSKEPVAKPLLLFYKPRNTLSERSEGAKAEGRSPEGMPKQPRIHGSLIDFSRVEVEKWRIFFFDRIYKIYIIIQSC